MPPALKLPKNLLALTEDLTAPALGDADLSRLAYLVDASPEDFRKAMAGLLRRLAIQGFRTIQAPRNYKEMATVVDLWRKLEGMDKSDKGGGLPAGLVGVMRSVQRRPVQRRPVMEAEEVEPVMEADGDCGFE